MSTSILSVDIGPTELRWGIVGEGFELFDVGEVTHESTNVDALTHSLAELAANYGSHCEALCLSVPGSVDIHDSQGSVIGGGRLPFLDGVPLGAEVSLVTGLPVAVENNGKAFALGEFVAGALVGSTVGVGITIGSNVGGGIVVDGRVLRGAHDFAGEFSFVRHTPIVGQHRSSDAMGGICSWQGLRRSVLEAKGLPDDDAIDGHQLFEWINAGDDDALRGLYDYAKDLCTWIFNLQCIVDPDVVALGGGISVQPALLEALHIAMRSMMASLQVPQVPRPSIVMAELGLDARLVGAVYSAIQG